jgi:exodeoxyribonuclease-1
MKSVHVNKCPVLVTPKMADRPTAARLGIDGELCRMHLKALRTYRDRDAASFTAKIQAIYRDRRFEEVTDPDLMLYSGGFFSDRDRQVMADVRSQPPEGLAAGTFVFEDRRLPEMLFRYRARNYPDSLDAAEREAWEEFRFQRLTEPDSAAGYCMEAFQVEIEALLGAVELPDRDRAILEQLLDYGDALLA